MITLTFFAITLLAIRIGEAIGNATRNPFRRQPSLDLDHALNLDPPSVPGEPAPFLPSSGRVSAQSETQTKEETTV